MSITSKQFLTSALSQLERIQMEDALATADANHNSVLANLKGTAADQAKSTFLSLHFLFPHELLPALDLLDRKLVNRFRCQTSEVFYIQSASAVTDPVNRRANPRFRNAYSATKVHYEVRLDSWNCSCAAFAQASLKLLLFDRGDAEDSAAVNAKSTSAQSNNADTAIDFTFGGVATMEDGPIPICKHILAAAIGSAAPNLFGGSMQVREVSVQEMAAWAAGWGES